MAGSLALSPETLSVVVTGATMVIALAASMFALVAHLSERRLRTHFGREMRGLAERNAILETFLAAEPGIAFLWEAGTLKPGAGLPAPQGAIGSDPEGSRHTPSAADAFDRVRAGLAHEGRSVLERRLRGLLGEGRGFVELLPSLRGGFLAVRGEIHGARALLRLRAASTAEAAFAASNADGQRHSEAAARLPELAEALPVPAWIADADGLLVWSNAAYRAAARIREDEPVEGRPSRLAEAAGDVDEPSWRIVRLPLSAESREEACFALPISASEAREETAPATALRSTLDRLPTAAAWFGKDRRLQLWNEAFRALWRVESQWLDQRPSDGELLERLRESRQLTEQADFQDWKHNALERFGAVGPPIIETWHLPDGRHLRLTVLPHPQGGFLLLFDDLTQVIELESSLNSVVKVQRTTLDNLHEAVATFGSDGRLKLWNDAFAKLWRFAHENLAGEPHFNRLVAHCRTLFDHSAEWARIGERVTSLGPERRPFGARIERNDGTVLDYAAIPLPDGGTLLTFLDVTDTIRIERALRDRNEALETADRLKSEFISKVSYQLRTPLNTIIGFAEMMSGGLTGKLRGKGKEYAGNILVAATELKSLISDILDLAMIEAGTLKLDLATVAVGDLIEMARAFAEPHAKEAEITLAVDAPESLGSIVADGRRLGQVLANLVSNALRYSRAGDTITIGANETPTGVRLYVEDTGAGILPEHQASVFGRFETRGVAVRDGSATRGPGAGLGLALVKSFIELHGGWVTLESTPGKGTKVVCYVPRHVAAPAALPPEEPDAGVAR